MPVQIINGNVFDVLPTLPEKSFHTCITSPPYFGLRDYGTATWEGGDPNCDHKIPANEHDPKRGTSDASTSHTLRFNRTHCHKCGAMRIDEQLGLEAIPEEYVANMVKVFREVKRVLRDDGTLWLNIGDSYCNSNGFARASPEYQREGRNNMPANDRKLDKLHATGLKTKDLIGIPWMLAFALRADGWYLRQDIIWHKPNPMPESVEDRCTKAHEYIFLLSKSSKYYFDHEAIKEKSNGWPINGAKSRGETDYANASGIKKHPQQDAYGGLGGDGETRNKRSVWTVTTKPFKGAHFAVFPEDLIIPCILAGSPERGHVLDPFGGSGTTGVVSNGFGRDATLIELNPEYAAIAKDRIGMFAI